MKINYDIRICNRLFRQKIDENDKFIRCSVYDLRVTNKVRENEVDIFLEYAKLRLENLNYNVFFTGARYKYNDSIKVVSDNEYMIAIKE